MDRGYGTCRAWNCPTIGKSDIHGAFRLISAVTIRMGNAAGRKDRSAMIEVTKAGAVISVCWSLTIILFVGFVRS